MVEFRADKARQAGRGDQRFGFAGFGIGNSATGEIGAEDEISGKHGAGDRKAKGGNGERAEVQEGNHVEKVISLKIISVLLGFAGTRASGRNGVREVVSLQARALLATKACQSTSNQLDSEQQGRRTLQSPGRVEGYKHAIHLFRSQRRFRN